MKLSLGSSAIIVLDGNIGYISVRDLPEDHSIKVWFQLNKRFQTRKFLMNLPEGPIFD